MALTAQDIISAVSTDMRTVLGASGADATTILGWVDRIHKDVLHSSLFNVLIRGVTTITTTANTASYALTPTNIRRILIVYDRTFLRELLPFHEVVAPLPLAQGITPASRAGTPFVSQISEEQVRPAFRQAKVATPYPQYYHWIGTTDTIYLFPAPVSTTWIGTIEIHYETDVSTLTATTSPLTVPDDGKDVLVAGTNYLTAMFLKRPEEAQAWAQIYEKLKQGEIIL